MQHTQIEYPFDLTAPGAIDQLIAFHRSWAGNARMEDDGGNDNGGAGDGGDGGQGGDNDGGDGGTGNDGGDGAGGKDLGFPPNTPVAEMTPEQARAYFENKAKTEESRRKGLSRAVGGRTAEQIQADLNELEELRRGRMSEQEKAVEDAKAEARAATLAEVSGELVKARFEAALAHVEDDRRDTIISGLNLSAYLNDDGKVDTDKVKKYAESIAPVDTTTTRRRDFGAGSRREPAPTRGASGKAEAARRFGKSTSTADA